MAWPVIAALAASTGAQLLGNYWQSEAAKDATDKELAARREAAEYLKQQGQLTDAEYNDIVKQIDNYYAQRGSLGTQQDANEYKAAIQGYKPEDFVYDFKDFEYDKTKEDFLNPYYNQIISDAAQKAQGSAAGAGMGRSTWAAQNIARAVAQKEDELYKTALSEYNTDRSQAYKEYSDAITRNQAQLNALREGTQYKMGLQGNLAQDYFNTQDQAMSDKLKAEQDRLAAKQTYAQAIGRPLLRRTQ